MVGFQLLSGSLSSTLGQGTLTLPRSTQMYKLVLASIMLGVTSYPSSMDPGGGCMGAGVQDETFFFTVSYAIPLW